MYCVQGLLSEGPRLNLTPQDLPESMRTVAPRFPAFTLYAGSPYVWPARESREVGMEKSEELRVEPSAQLRMLRPVRDTAP